MNTDPLAQAFDKALNGPPLSDRQNRQPEPLPMLNPSHTFEGALGVVGHVRRKIALGHTGMLGTMVQLDQTELQKLQ